MWPFSCPLHEMTFIDCFIYIPITYIFIRFIYFVPSCVPVHRYPHCINIIIYTMHTFTVRLRGPSIKTLWSCRRDTPCMCTAQQTVAVTTYHPTTITGYNTICLSLGIILSIIIVIIVGYYSRCRRQYIIYLPCRSTPVPGLFRCNLGVVLIMSLHPFCVLLHHSLHHFFSIWISLVYTTHSPSYIIIRWCEHNIYYKTVSSIFCIIIILYVLLKIVIFIFFFPKRQLTPLWIKYSKYDGMSFCNNYYTIQLAQCRIFVPPRNNT